MSYKGGVIKAIAGLKDRNGSSMQAIKKQMQDALPAGKKWSNNTFLTTLKSGVANGDFVKVKGSYKLSKEFKKKLVDAAKPKKPKKKAAPKKAAPKKPVPKKVPKPPAKSPAKKPEKKPAKKVAKSPASKKAAKKVAPKKK
jgi:hypothetical protein